MKKILDSIVTALRWIFGYGIMIALFVGGLTFFGYLAAMIIGGDTATTICTVIYKNIVPIMIKVSTTMILLGLLTMYLSGETALTAAKKPKKSQKSSES